MSTIPAATPIYPISQGSLITFICHIAPNGWHIASDNDWQTLIDYLGVDTIAGGKMKETGTAHWYGPNKGATNESGFTALPGGWRDPSGNFLHENIYVFFWPSTSESTNEFQPDRYLYFENTKIGHGTAVRRFGFSVRCVKD